MFAKSRFCGNQWVSASWSVCRNKTINLWDVCDFLLLIYFFNFVLRFLVAVFPQPFVAVLKLGPFFWQAQSSPGFSSGEQNSGGDWQPRGWILSTSCYRVVRRQHQSPCPVSSVPGVFLGSTSSVLGWILPQTQSPPPLRTSRSALRWCSALLREGKWRL